MWPVINGMLNSFLSFFLFYQSGNEITIGNIKTKQSQGQGGDVGKKRPHGQICVGWKRKNMKRIKIQGCGSNQKSSLDAGGVFGVLVRLLIFLFFTHLPSLVFPLKTKFLLLLLLLPCCCGLWIILCRKVCTLHSLILDSAGRADSSLTKPTLLNCYHFPSIPSLLYCCRRVTPTSQSFLRWWLLLFFALYPSPDLVHFIIKPTCMNDFFSIKLTVHAFIFFQFHFHLSSAAGTIIIYSFGSFLFLNWLVDWKQNFISGCLDTLHDAFLGL